MTEHDSRIRVLAEEPVLKAIMTMAIPVMLGMFVQVFYNMVDTFFIGKLNDVDQLAAASIGFPFFMLMMAIGGVLGVGTSSVVSRYLGMKKMKEAGEAVSLSLILILAAGIIVTAITASAIDPVVAMIGAKGSVAGPTKDYLLPLMISSIVIIGNFAVGIILRSEGAAMQAMTGMMVGTVVNIVLDPVMIFVFDMKIAGAAWATVIGNLAGLIYYLSCYFGKSIIKIKFTRNIFRLDYFREILSIGIPSGLNQALMSVAGIFLNNLAAGYGPVILAAMGVSQRLSSLIILLLIGLATGCQPLYGYNYGAKNKKRLISILKTSMALGVGIGSVLLAVFTIFGKPAIAVFTSIPEVVAEGVFILRAMTIAAPIIGINMICMNSLQAFGKAMPSLIISAGRQGLFYIPLLFTLNALFGYHGLVFTQAIVEVLTAIAASLMLRHVLRTDEHLRA